MQECGLIVAPSPDFSREDEILDFYVKYLNFQMLALVSSLSPLHGPNNTSEQANFGQWNASLILVQYVFYSGGETEANQDKKNQRGEMN